MDDTVGTLSGADVTDRADLDAVTVFIMDVASDEFPDLPGFAVVA